MSRAISRTVAKSIRAAGFPVSAAHDVLTPSDDVPDGDFVLFLTEDRKRLLVSCTSTPVLTILPSTMHRQAVITAEEPERIILESVQNYLRTSPNFATMSNDERVAFVTKELIEVRAATWRRYTHMQLPQNSVTTGKVVGFQTYLQGSIWVHVDIELTHVVPASVQHFLTGVDEDHLFICLLPRACTSVADAHAALRPPGLSSEAIRQGEFFFEPTDEVFESMHTGTFGLKATLEDEGIYDGEYDNGDHVVHMLVMKNETEFYTRGPVTNSRHKTLWLENRWYRVVRNLEIPAPDSAEYWD